MGYATMHCRRCELFAIDMYISSILYGFRVEKWHKQDTRIYIQFAHTHSLTHFPITYLTHSRNTEEEYKIGEQTHTRSKKTTTNEHSSVTQWLASSNLQRNKIKSIQLKKEREKKQP